MRISNLHIPAYGPFSDVKIPLQEAKSFHIIVGPNEAGKSSVLRALTALIYGIDTRTTDNFIHENSKLRVGGTLCLRSGESISFYRRKGTKNTILNEKDNPISDSDLSRFIPVTEQNVFKTFYGLDHHRLRQGGEELRKLGGDLARSLFIGSGGILSLSKAQELLQNEIADVRPKRGMKGLRRLIKEYKEERIAWKNHVLRPNEWIRLKDKLENLERELNGIRTEESRLIKRKSRLQRIDRSMHRVAKLKLLEDKIKSLGRIIKLPDDYPYERRKTTVDELTLARHTLEKIQLEIDGADGLQDQLKKITVASNIIASESLILDLYKRLGNHLKASSDARKLRSQVRQLKTEAMSILRELPIDESLDYVDSHRITVSDKAPVKKLSLEHRTVIERPSELKNQLDRSESQLKLLQIQLDSCPPSQDVTELKNLVRDVKLLGDIESQLHSHNHKISELTAKVNSLTNALQLWNDSADSLRLASIPMKETIDRFEREFGQLAEKITRANQRMEDFESREKSLQDEIQAVLIAGTVPTNQDLLDIRSRRDLGWSLVKDIWLTNSIDEKKIQEYTGGERLEIVYENAIYNADEIADRLRIEAKRVEKLALLRQQIESIRHQKSEEESIITELLKENESVSQRWKDIWTQAGITDPYPPEEMRSWLTGREEIIRYLDEKDENKSKLNLLQANIDKHFSKLSKVLQNIDETMPEGVDNLHELITVADSVIDTIEEANNNRLQFIDKQKDFKKEHIAISASIQEAIKHREKFESSWNDALTRIGLLPETTAEQAQAVLDRYEELYSVIDQIQSNDARINGIEADADEFQSDVSNLIGQIANDLTDKPVEEAMTELHKRLMEAKGNAQEAKRLQNQIADKTSQAKKMRDSQDKHIVFLDSLCQTASCEIIEDLEKREQTFREFKRLQEQIDEVRTELIKDSGGLTLGDFIKEIEESNQDAIGTELVQIEDGLKELSNKKESLINEKAERNADLKAIEHKEAAVEFEERCQSLLSQIRRSAHKYVVFWLSREILNSEIERMKVEEQTPVLEKAGLVFSAITCGSFARLGIEYDENDVPFLVGIRPDGTDINITGMSDGTRDQLYLSLRLAYITNELDAEGIEPMPFIADDILVNFDNDRARAALMQLANLSKSTQVIFFTHHRHLVELAQDSKIADSMDIQELKGLEMS